MPLVEVHLSNVDEREEWRRHSVLEGIPTPASWARGRKATARRWSCSSRGGAVSRIDRLSERLERPLLVTNLINVRYLTGLASSNAALLVDDERVRLFTDFRYIERAQAIDGVEVVRTARDVIGDLPGARRRAGSRSRRAT